VGKFSQFWKKISRVFWLFR